MVFSGKGFVGEGLYVTGLSWSPVYLLQNDPPVLFEAGFHCAQRLYERDIREILGKRDPEFLFLTHVHWDHCGSASYFKRVFQLKILTSERAKEIIRRKGAIERIKNLSEKVIPHIEKVEGIDKELLVRIPFEPFDVDQTIGEGTLEINSLKIQVFSTPGHTRDMLSFYIPERKILIATEACGTMDKIGQYIPQFLVDFDLYMDSLFRLSELDVKILCQGHHFVFTDSDVGLFFENSIRAAYNFKERVETLLKEEGFVVERVVERIKATEYDINPHVKQIEEAYIMNLKERVKYFAEKFR